MQNKGLLSSLMGAAALTFMPVPGQANVEGVTSFPGVRPPVDTGAPLTGSTPRHSRRPSIDGGALKIPEAKRFIEQHYCAPALEGEAVVREDGKPMTVLFVDIEHPSCMFSDGVVYKVNINNECPLEPKYKPGQPLTFVQPDTCEAK
jgi:hypothetical protein